MDGTLVLPKIDRDLCTGCADCVDVCHVNALGIRGAKAVLVKPGACDYCTDCEAVCPAHAIACPFEVVVGDARI
jgi:MinD superfamily P-loop ATPase